MIRDIVIPPSPAHEGRLPTPPKLRHTGRLPSLLLVDPLQPVQAYQPVVALANGRIVAAEMVLGWPMRQPQPIRSNQARRQRVIGQMQIAVQAATQWPDNVALWLDAPGMPDIDLGSPDRIAVLLRDCGLAPERLSLELPESLGADIDIDRLIWLSALRDLGVGVILDGFGSWVASLATLRRLPLTGMKLDAGLVRGVPEDREDVAIVRAAVDAARSLGVQVIAEGVETESQRAFLSAIGCEYGQGVLFSHPLQDDALRHYVSRGATRSTNGSAAG